MAASRACLPPRGPNSGQFTSDDSPLNSQLIGLLFDARRLALWCYQFAPYGAVVRYTTCRYCLTVQHEDSLFPGKHARGCYVGAVLDRLHALEELVKPAEAAGFVVTCEVCGAAADEFWGVANSLVCIDCPEPKPGQPSAEDLDAVAEEQRIAIATGAHFDCAACGGNERTCCCSPANSAIEDFGEPWRVLGPENVNVVQDRHEREVYFAGATEVHEADEQRFARRVATCVNFLRGISTKNLESTVELSLRLRDWAGLDPHDSRIGPAAHALAVRLMKGGQL